MRYTKDYEWNGFSVHPARKGWVVEYWSREQGARTGVRLLYPYTGEFPRGTDLNASWNDYGDMGEALAWTAPGSARTKVLNRGRRVQ